MNPDTINSGNADQPAQPATGAGRNPSTGAGITVLTALAVLLIARRAFRAFLV